MIFGKNVWFAYIYIFHWPNLMQLFTHRSSIANSRIGTGERFYLIRRAYMEVKQ